MRRLFAIIIAVLALADISCSDKSRLLSAVQNGKELPNGSTVPVFMTQNYPNPFTRITSIPFDVFYKTNMKLQVKTEDWVDIKTLVDTVEPYGVYRVSWDAQDVPSGEYLAVLTAGGVTETIRMRVIK